MRLLERYSMRLAIFPGLQVGTNGLYFSEAREFELLRHIRPVYQHTRPGDIR